MFTFLMFAVCGAATMLLWKFLRAQNKGAASPPSATQMAEKVFLIMAPLPFVLSIVVPGAIAVATNFANSARVKMINSELTWVAVWLGCALFLPGVVLTTRSFVLRQHKAAIVLVATLLAGAPGGILLLYYILFTYPWGR